MKFKFITIFSLLLLIIISSTVQFQGNIDNSSQTESITIWFHEKGFKEDFLIKKIINFNESQSDLSVIVDFISSESFLSQYLLDQASGFGPDLIHVKSDWLAPLADKESILALDEVILNEDDYITNVLRSVKANLPSGEIKIFGYPLSVDTTVLFYNSQVIGDLQFELPEYNELWTWNDFTKALIFLTNITDPENKHYGLGTIDISKTFDI
ncbi:MAG: ABC transporter substrate-binding protein, partial [Candidatus Kariarchaeaceae archaeon]